MKKHSEEDRQEIKTGRGSKRRRGGRGGWQGFPGVFSPAVQARS